MRDFRGIGNSTVEFGAGVTVIEGPNEVGKSSIAHGIRLIREFKASSRHHEIVSIKPVHRDVGPEVELELFTGQYNLTYRKRWLKSPITELTVRTPTPEQHTGDAAHDRFLTILQQTVDMDLLAALDVLQGSSLDQPDLAQITALHRALDESTGEVEGHDVLMERIEKEYDSYFTRTGRPSGEYKAILQRLPELDAKVVELRARSEEMDRFTDEFAHFSRLSERLVGELSSASDDLRQRTVDAGAIDSLRDVAAEAGRALGDAQRDEQLAESARGARTDLVADFAARERAIAQESDRVLALLLKHDEAKGRLDTSIAAVEELEVSFEHARASTKMAITAVSRKQNFIEFEELSDRAKRAESAESQRVAATAELEMANIDEAMLTQLNLLETDLRVAESARTAAAAQVVVQPLSATSVRVDDDEIPAGKSFETVAFDTVRVEIEGVVRLEIRPGTPPADLQRAVSDANRILNSALSDAGADSMADARELANRRREADGSLANAQSALAALLGNVSVDVLQEQVAVVAARIRRDTGGEPTDELQTLEKLAKKAQDDEAGVEAKLGTAQGTLERRREAVDTAREEWVRGSSALSVGEQECDRVKETLERDRSLQDDESLENAVLDTQRVLAERVGQADSANAALEAADPDTLAMLLNNAQTLVVSKEVEITETRSQLDRLTALLDDRATEGIYDKLSAAEATYEAAKSKHLRLDRAARAINLLRDTMRRHREEVQKKYAAPFKAQIERLGRVVFGRDFAVEISNELSIKARTLDGRTVPFESLSAGAREQLSLLGRLACAQLVDVSEGAPVVLDDALGFSDPDRLVALNAVLSEVGRSAQVILLTCQPDRFSAIGGAQMAHLVAS